MEQQNIANGGMQIVIPNLKEQQIIYLDFDGELTSYNGEILTIDNVVVQDSSLTEERIANIVTQLNAQYSAKNVIFVTQNPEKTEYSTIYIGKTTAFDSYGNFAGLAETIDENNSIKNDNAFVMLDSTTSDEEIISTITHETDHLLGILNHGGEGLETYAADTIISAGRTSNGLAINSGNSLTVLGTVNSASIDSNGSMFISNGGKANNTKLNYNGKMYILSGGTASNTVINSEGSMYVSSGGKANNTTINSSGYMNINKGGSANNITINSHGTLYISSGATATNIVWSPFVGTISAYEGAYVTYATQHTGVYLGSKSSLSSHTTIMENKVVSNSAAMYVMKTGIANNTNMTGGNMYISNGGIASNTTISRGIMHISSGGTASSAIVSGRGSICISSGGIAKDIINNAYIWVFAGGTAQDVTNNGTIYTKYGGKIYNTINNGGISFYGGYAYETIINGTIWISGGIVDYSTINSGGLVYVNAGSATNTNVNYGGTIIVSSGGSASVVFNPWSGGIVGTNITYLDRDAEIYYGNSTVGLVSKYNNSVLNHTINSGYSTIVYSGGAVNNTTVNSGGNLYLSNEGTANGTTVNLGGKLYISSGGTAVEVKENGGFVYVYDEANATFLSNTINGIFLSSYDSMSVHHNTIASDTTVDYYGYLQVSSGGVVNNTTVNGGFSLYSSGVANSTTINSYGCLEVSSDGTANNTTVNSGGKMYIFNGGIHCSSLQINIGATISANSGAIIDFTLTDRTASDDYLINDLSLIQGAPTYTITVAADQTEGTYKLAQGAGNFTGTISIGDATTNYGSITVNGDALINNNVKYTLTQNSGNLLLNVQTAAVPAVFIYSSGTLTSSGSEITSAIIAFGGNNSMFVSSGGTANSTTIDSKGNLLISSGGVATNTIVNGGGFLWVGGNADNIILNGNPYGHASMNIGPLGMVNNATVNSRGYVQVIGTIVNTEVNGSGSMRISSGGFASNTTINSGGLVTIFSGGSAEALTIALDGMLGGFSFSGEKYWSDYTGGVTEIFDNVTINGDAMDVASAGKVEGVTVHAMATMQISSGGSADGIKVLSRGYLRASTNVNITNLTASAGARLFIEVAPETYIQGTVDGSAFELNSGKLSGYTINSGGYVGVENGGIVAETIIDSYTYLHVFSGGMATRNIVNSMGELVVSSGGSAEDSLVNSHGYLTLTSGGVHNGSLQIAEGAIVSAYSGAIINFTIENRTASDNYLINDLSLIKGTPTYTVTVADNQAFGTYKLAQGANNFTNTISIGCGTVNYGLITVNGEILNYNGVEYLVTQKDGELKLTISDLTPPETPIATANIETLTNQDVIITVVYSEDSSIKQYRIGENGEWQNYTNAFTVTDNATIYFLAKDAAGNESTSQFVIDYIDKIAPSLEISGNVETWINQDVILTASANEGTIEYFDGSNWISGNNITATKNGVYQFRVTDNAGNVTEKSVIVDKIDKSKPQLSIISDNTEPYANTVTLTASVVEDNLVSLEYSFNNNTWQTYNGPITITSNLTVNFRASDLAGNITYQNYEVNNIGIAPVQIYSSSTMTSSGGTINGVVISGNNSMYVSSGGVTNNTTVTSYGKMYIYSSGMANSAMVNSDGCMYISSGGSANSTTVNSGGRIFVCSGGNAINTTITGTTYTYMTVYSGGSANNISVNTGTLYVDSNAVVQNVTIAESNGNIYIASNAIVQNLTVSAGGAIGGFIFTGNKTFANISNGSVIINNNVNIIGSQMHISSGGIMTDLKTKRYQYALNGSSTREGIPGIFVHSGGTLNRAILSSASLQISSGGVANSTNLNTYSYMGILSGGTANNTIINSHGSMYISEGGVHRGSLQIFSGGNVSAYAGSIIDFNIVNRTTTDNYLINNLSLISGAPTYTITVSANQTQGTYKLAQGASNFNETISIGDDTTIYGSITVNGSLTYGLNRYTLTQNNGYLTLSVSDIPTVFIYSSGTLTSSGTTINNAIISGAYNSMHVSSGGIVNSTNVITRAHMMVYSGGVANNTNLYSHAQMHMYSGANVSNLKIYSYASGFISSGAVISNVYVSGFWAWFYAQAGATTYNTTLAYDAVQQTAKGATAYDTIVNNKASHYVHGSSYNATIYLGGYEGVEKTAYASGTLIYSGGSQLVLGIVDKANIKGTMSINKTGIGNYNTINYSGKMYLSGGTANNTIINSEGGMYVLNGGTANNTIVNSEGSMYISNGGSAQYTSVGYYGDLKIHEGSLANNTVIDNYGDMYVSSGGTANETTVKSNGELFVYDQGVVSNTSISFGGYLRLYSGAVHRNIMQIESGANVLAYEGSVIDFTIFNRTTENDYLINNISLISETPSYTITISANQAFGTYKLAQGASNFTGTISIGDVTTNYGSITVNGEVFKYNNVDYLVTQENGNLHLSIGDFTPPETPIVTADITTLTNKDVSVSVLFSEDSTLKQYRIGENGEWQNYSNAFTITDNETIYFRAEDSAGNEINSQYVINYIDKVAPNLDISGNATQWTNQDVTLTAKVSDGIVEFFNGKEWITGDVQTVTDNGTYTFKVTDAAGNVTEKDVVVSFIDKVAPVAPVATANITSITNKDVIISATFSEDSVVKQYSINGKDWETYTNTIVMTNNGVVTFRGIDAVGNISDVTTYEVTNIDKVAPTLDITGNATEWTNKDVTLTAKVDNGIVEFFNGKEWITGDVQTVTDNGTYTFKVTDAAGNVTEKDVVVSFIDKVAPVAPVATANITSITNKDVIISATFSEDSVVKQYSINGKDWETYTNTIVMTNNGVVTFRGIDAAGNISDVTTYEVTNIDKVAPTLNITGNATEWTNQDVTLTAKVSDGIVEFFNGKEWITGDLQTVTDNGTYTFKVTDAAGNVTEKDVVVSFIDKVAPVAPVATANITSITNKDVIISATFSEDSVVKQYSINGKDWETYTNDIVMTKNGIVTFRGIDAAGNISDVTSHEVTNIDKVAPTLNITGNPTQWTNQDVTLTANVSDGVVEFFNGKEWITGDVQTVTDNGTYTFKVTDAAGNVTIKDVEVSFIDKIAPTLDITGNATKWTNQDITLTANVSDGVVEFFNGKEWITGDVQTVTDNGTYTFKVTDAAGNVTEKDVVVSFIDKVAPDKPNASADITFITNKDVTLTATFSEDSVTKQYSINGKDWEIYTNAIVMTNNGVVTFRGIDAAGNISDVTSYEVTNIDKVAPTLNITGNPTQWTNQDVTLTANVSDGKVEFFDGKNWVDGATQTVTENGTYTFKVTDKAGNVTIKDVEVSLIDKIAPTLNITGNATAWTNKDVTLTANVSDGKVEFFNGKNWVAGSTHTISANGTYTFKVTDKAGNVTIKDVEVSFIDKVAPTLNITGNPTNWTNKDVTLSASANEESIIEFFNGKNWVAGSTHTISANGTYTFKVTDKAGNVTIKDVIVDKIDKTNPLFDIKTDAKIWSNQDVTIKANVNENGCIIQYQIDNGSWQQYSKNVVVSENCTVNFKVTDKAGNITTKSVTIDSIDESADALDSTTVIFISSKYNEKTTGKKQDGIVLTYGENAFSTIEDALAKYPYFANNLVVMVDSKTNINTSINLPTITGTTVTPTIKETDNSYSYKATSQAKNSITITKDTGNTEFIRFATVDVNGGDVETIVGGKLTNNKETATIVDKKGTINTTDKFTNTTNATGKFTATNNATIENVENYSTVNLTNASVNEVTAGNTKVNISSKIVDAYDKYQKTISCVDDNVAAGSITLTDGANASEINAFANVTLNSATAGNISNYTSKDSKSETTTFDEGKKTVTRKVTLSHTENTAGTLKATNVESLGDVTGFATVTLLNVNDAGDFKRVDENGNKYSTVKETLDVKTNKDKTVTGKYTKTETFTRNGKFTATNSNIGDIANYSTVTLDGTTANNISNFQEAKIVTTGTATWKNMNVYGRPNDYDLTLEDFDLIVTTTKSLNGSVTLKNNAKAESITNYQTVTLSNSTVDEISNVNKVSVSKGKSIITSYVGTSENDTLSIAKDAVLIAKSINLGDDAKDTINLAGTIILTGREFVATNITGKGEIVATSDVYKKLDINFANVLDIGETAENFKGTAFETSDNTLKKAAKWDPANQYDGWMGSWSGTKDGSDEVDFITFKANAGDTLVITNLSDSNWTLFDKKGNEIVDVTIFNNNTFLASGEYILKLENNEDKSISYSVKLA